ncbi:MarR family transcriptional regulator [Nguyenibacter vanlangensis]|uniref:MarR family transcriptional regulator n=2 Tax=Nguyenibacter vanlangensis TaxID=1216886 RepID=A0ABZ3DAQ7_9PROT
MLDPTLLNPTGPDPTAPEALAMMLRVVTGKLKRRLREQAAQDGFNLSQLSVLSRLERAGPATVSALARAEGMRTQSMGPHIAALEAAGLVRGSPDPADGRQTILSLTAQFRTWVAGRRAAREDWLAGILAAHFSAAERADLARALPLLERLAES